MGETERTSGAEHALRAKTGRLDFPVGVLTLLVHVERYILTFRKAGLALIALISYSF